MYVLVTWSLGGGCPPRRTPRPSGSQTACPRPCSWRCGRSPARSPRRPSPCACSPAPRSLSRSAAGQPPLEIAAVKILLQIFKRYPLRLAPKYLWNKDMFCNSEPQVAPQSVGTHWRVCWCPGAGSASCPRPPPPRRPPRWPACGAPCREWPGGCQTLQHTHLTHNNPQPLYHTTHWSRLPDKTHFFHRKGIIQESALSLSLLLQPTLCFETRWRIFTELLFKQLVSMLGWSSQDHPWWAKKQRLKLNASEDSCGLALVSASKLVDKHLVYV